MFSYTLENFLFKSLDISLKEFLTAFPAVSYDVLSYPFRMSISSASAVVDPSGSAIRLLILLSSLVTSLVLVVTSPLRLARIVASSSLLVLDSDDIKSRVSLLSSY